MVLMMSVTLRQHPKYLRVSGTAYLFVSRVVRRRETAFPDPWC